VRLDPLHRVVQRLAEISALRKLEEVIEARLLGQVQDAPGVVIGGADLATIRALASSSG
jgi:hypothetical protein